MASRLASQEEPGSRCVWKSALMRYSLKKGEASTIALQELVIIGVLERIAGWQYLLFEQGFSSLWLAREQVTILFRQPTAADPAIVRTKQCRGSFPSKSCHFGLSSLREL